MYKTKSWAGTQDRSGDWPNGERITEDRAWPLSKELSRITGSPNPKAAKDYNCPNGSFFDARSQRFLKSTVYIRVWRGVRAAVSRRSAFLVSTSKGYEAVRAWFRTGSGTVVLSTLRAWFKTGSGTVVLSTLRAVPATVPDPVLNQWAVRCRLSLRSRIESSEPKEVRCSRRTALHLANPTHCGTWRSMFPAAVGERVHSCTMAREMLKLAKFVQCPARVSGSLLRSASHFGISRSGRKMAFAAIIEPYCASLHVSNDQLSRVFTKLSGGQKPSANRSKARGAFMPIIPAPHVNLWHERPWRRGADFGGAP
jgi:hypothetical protein